MTARKGFTALECVISTMIVSILLLSALPLLIKHRRDNEARLQAPAQMTVAVAPAYVPPLEVEQPAPVRHVAPPAPVQPQPQPQLTIQWTDVTVSGAAVNPENTHAVITWFGSGKVKLGFRSDGVLVWRQVP